MEPEKVKKVKSCEKAKLQLYGNKNNTKPKQTLKLSSLSRQTYWARGFGNHWHFPLVGKHQPSTSFCMNLLSYAVIYASAAVFSFLLWWLSCLLFCFIAYLFQRFLHSCGCYFTLSYCFVCYWCLLYIVLVNCCSVSFISFLVVSTCCTFWFVLLHFCYLFLHPDLFFLLVIFILD